MQSETSPATSEFEQELGDYLKALRLPTPSADKAQALCRQHDFSSARVHIIISCPGYHSGTAPGMMLTAGVLPGAPPLQGACCQVPWLCKGVCCQVLGSTGGVLQGPLRHEGGG